MPVHLQLEGPVATLTLDEPGRKNAMTPELGEALQARVSELRTNRDVRAVVLCGAGGTFSGGGDLAMLERLRHVPREESRRFMLGFYERYLSILELEVPTLALVEGAAIGAGLCLALACDLHFVERSARLALNFVSLGLHPGMGATYFVPWRAGAATASRLLMSGERFDGAAAVELGLLKRVDEPGAVRAHAYDIATRIASQAPLAVRALKRQLGPDRAALRACLEHEAEQQSISYASADMAEGLSAANGKRAPRFTGT